MSQIICFKSVVQPAALLPAGTLALASYPPTHSPIQPLTMLIQCVKQRQQPGHVVGQLLGKEVVG